MKKPATSAVLFIFLGGIAPGRGLEQLVKNWKDTPSNALLHIRGSHNAFSRELQNMALSAGNGGGRISFLDPVKESELLSALDGYDVGIIPYEPVCLNNLHCCPNKLSQYMSQGLVLLCNKLPFVEETIYKAQCGISADFSDEKLFGSAVEKICTDELFRDSCRVNARKYFETTFNWQAVSMPFYETLNRLSSPQNNDNIRLADASQPDFLWNKPPVHQLISVKLRHRLAAGALKVYRSAVPEKLRLEIWDTFSTAEKLTGR